MVQINFAQKTVNVKIVFYGPGMSGKTTNLEVVHQRAPDSNRGELTSISTDGDRTLFFDYMPLNLGTVGGMQTSFQVYTVPGQVYYNSTRKLVLQGVDGVIFVADSSASMLQENLESLRNLEENLNEYGKSLASIPHVVQFNKRDLPDAMPVDELERHLNSHGAPTFEAVASTGQGVFPTLKALAASVLKSIMRETKGGSPQPSTAPPAAFDPAPPPLSEAPLAMGEPAPPAAAPPVPAQPLSVPLDVVSPSAPPAAAQAAPMPAPQPVARAAAAPLAVAEASPEASGAAELMAAPGARPAARRTPRRTPTPPPPVRQPKAKSSAMTTGLFLVLAMGVGAGLAWTAITLL